MFSPEVSLVKLAFRPHPRFNVPHIKGSTNATCRTITPGLLRILVEA